MSSTRSYFHIVFGTKYRQRSLHREGRIRLYKYITEIVKNKKSDMIAINGIEDHVHILLNLHPTIALSDMVKIIKQSSSKMIKESNYFPLYEGWANEYYACSVSPSHVEGIKAYIKGQEEHHKGKGYEEEIRNFVSKMGLELYKDEL